jgi:hypothetical protein
MREPKLREDKHRSHRQDHNGEQCQSPSTHPMQIGAGKSHNDQQPGRRDHADTGGPLVIRAQDLQHQHNEEGKERRADHRSGNPRVVGGDLGQMNPRAGYR